MRVRAVELIKRIQLSSMELNKSLGFLDRGDTSDVRCSPARPHTYTTP